VFREAGPRPRQARPRPCPACGVILDRSRRKRRARGQGERRTARERPRDSGIGAHSLVTFQRLDDQLLGRATASRRAAGGGSTDGGGGRHLDRSGVGCVRAVPVVDASRRGETRQEKAYRERGGAAAPPPLHCHTLLSLPRPAHTHTAHAPQCPGPPVLPWWPCRPPQVPSPASKRGCGKCHRSGRDNGRASMRRAHLSLQLTPPLSSSLSPQDVPTLSQRFCHLLQHWCVGGSEKERE